MREDPTPEELIAAFGGRIYRPVAERPAIGRSVGWGRSGGMRIPVNKRTRTFTTYTAGPAAVAVANIGDLDVMIRCATRRLSKLALDLVEPGDLKQAMQRQQ